MDYSSIRNIKKSRKSFICDWCGQKIEMGQPYIRYRIWDSGDTGTCREHPECYEAMMEMERDPWDDNYFFPGDNPRGCNCGFDRTCERCKERKEKC